MNTILWIVQCVLFIKFITTAYSHGLKLNDGKMRRSVEQLGGRGTLLHRAIALILLFSACGLLFPSILGGNTSMTLVSAFVLALMAALSIVLHARSREKPVIIADIVLMLLAAFVFIGRWIDTPR
jgi:hypothetical protein